MAKKKNKKSDDTVKIAVLVGIVVLAAFGRYRLNSKKGGTRVTQSSRSGQRGGRPANRPAARAKASKDGAAVSSPAVQDPNRQITVRPDDIPQLSEEVKARLENRGLQGQGIYAEAKLVAGFNPFLPFEVKDPISGDSSVSLPGQENKKRKSFSRQILFYGAFTTGDETRAILEIDGDPIPQTVLAGEPISGTPYRLRSISPDGRFVQLENPEYQEDAPRLYIKSRDGPSNAGTSGDASKLFRQEGDDEKPDASARERGGPRD